MNSQKTRSTKIEQTYNFIVHSSNIMTHCEIIQINLDNSNWEIRKDKCDSTHAHRRHLAANGKPENKQKSYCTNVHRRIIGILITLMYKLRAVTLMPLQVNSKTEEWQEMVVTGRLAGAQLYRIPSGCRFHMIVHTADPWRAILLSGWLRK